MYARFALTSGSPEVNLDRENCNPGYKLTPKVLPGSSIAP